MTLYSRLSAYASAWRTYREEAETRRLLSGLPNEILKDIGWPEGVDRRRRSIDGSWIGGR